MYEKFYGLHTKPFSIIPNPDCLFLSEKHQNAITYLEYGLTENIAFILLTGNVGTGKTTLVRHLTHRIEAETEVAEVYNTSVSPDQLILQILQEFGLKSHANDKLRCLETLNRFLINRYASGKKVLLIIDEAQNLSNEGMEEIRLLSNLQAEDQILMPILLVGHPELKIRLKNPSLKQLAQRIGVSYHLPPLDKQETADYIVYRIEKVGGKASLFSARAMAFIFEATGGIPRSINLLCDAALVFGFADGARTIHRALAEAVVNEQGGMGIGLAGNGNGAAANLAPKNGHTHLKKLAAIESDLRKLMAFTAQQMKSQQQSMHSIRKNLANELLPLIKTEKSKNAALKRKYVQLKKQYTALASQLKGNRSH